MHQGYRDREEAGRVLARGLADYRGKDVIVMALPRGGVPVGAVVAADLGAPLDVLVIRKLGLPGQSELAMGAIASGARILNDRVVRSAGVTQDMIDRVEQEEREELLRRERAYRGDEPFPDLDGKTVLVVDDGIATGASMKVAVEALRQHAPARIVVAVPVAPPETVAGLRHVADDVVCPRTPSNFIAISQWYEDFGQTTDSEVQHLVVAARRRREGLDRKETS